MTLITLNNIDCIIEDKCKGEFENLDRCIEQCKILEVNVFVVINNMVYYKSNSIKNCILNINKCDFNDVTTYILIPDNMESYHVDTEERIKLYTHGIYDTIIFSNKLTYNNEKLKTFLNNNTSTTWIFQHHKNLLKFIGDNEFNFEFNPYDLCESRNIPTFVKSRNILLKKESILLPLEELYIPSYYIDILKDDIPFNKKLKNCVWRGANSGHFFDKNINRSSREYLILKYGKNDKYNIGLSYANYKYSGKEPLPYNIEEFVKQKLSIKEQLNYMFVISVEGNDFATNLSWIMLSNSVPLMPVPYVETWKMEQKLIPYIHYVPLNNDFSDLDEKMEWCLANLDKCEEIAYMSKLYILQFFDKEKENNIINEVINIYKKNVFYSP
jgi:hypothetical protein